MASDYHTPIRLAKDQPALRRPRRRKLIDAATAERLQRDFWKYFDIEKFASDWRAGLGRRAAP